VLYCLHVPTASLTVYIRSESCFPFHLADAGRYPETGNEKKTTDQPQSSSTPLVISIAFRGIFDIFQKYFRRNGHTRNRAFQI
jgi:hypothetical protein